MGHGESRCIHGVFTVSHGMGRFWHREGTATRREPNETEAFYIPEKRKCFGDIMFSTATQPPHRRPPPPSAASSHHFVVSAITFEGFKLRSSNLTHALFIQISRTSSITDIVVQSKMAAGGHFVQKFQKKKSCVSI